MADYPDVYADGVAITTHQFGLTVTFQLSQPNLDVVGPHVDPKEIVCRVRMGAPLAKVLAQGLNDGLAQQVTTVQQPGSKAKN